MSQLSLAKLAIEMNCVGLSPQTSSFTVRSVNSNRVHAVSLYPEPTYSSCPSTGKCYHIFAIEMAVGTRKIILCLGCVREPKGREGKSGRKKARTKDYDYDVDPAEDSVAVPKDSLNISSIYDCSDTEVDDPPNGKTYSAPITQHHVEETKKKKKFHLSVTRKSQGDKAETKKKG